MDNIYLVGFMGTGKSAVGQELARRSKRQFVDLDELIELREKKTIADIFAQQGEPYFRRLEKKTLKDVAKEKGFVVACGGGIVIDSDNIRIMKENGTVVCLQAACEVILARTMGQSHRPLLNVANPRERIELLLKMRAPYYAQADTAVDTSKLSVEQAAQSIEKALKPAKSLKPSRSVARPKPSRSGAAGTRAAGKKKPRAR
jgi:shikimate kinase